MNAGVAVGDSDAIIAMVLDNDPNHPRALKIASRLIEQNVDLVFPSTVFPEAITSLVRAANQPDKAHLVNKNLQDGLFHVFYIDREVLLNASELFGKTKSKQNTFFDAIVASVAKKFETKTIFSFDKWYSKLGFKLAD